MRYIIAGYLIYIGVLLIRNTLQDHTTIMYLIAGIAVIIVGIVYMIFTTRWLLADNAQRRKEREEIEKRAANEEQRDLLDDSDNPFA